MTSTHAPIATLVHASHWPAASGANPFLQPGWFRAAAAWAGTRGAPLAWQAHHGAEVLGALPLLATRRSVAGLPVRRLESLAIPDTQCWDLLVAPGQAEHAAEALARALVERRAEWDELELRHLTRLSMNWALLQAQLEERGVACEIAEATRNPRIDLAAGFEPWYAARGKSLRKAAALNRNRLARAGEVSIERVEGSGWQAALAEATRISAASWKRHTGNSLDQPGPQASFAALTEWAAESGRLSLWLLRVNGRAVAFEYQLHGEGRVYALRSDFDETLGEASPGSQLNLRLLETLFTEGLSAYYFGPGGNAYKQRWTEDSDPVWTLRTWSPTTRGRAVRALETHWRPRLRALRDRWRGTEAVPDTLEDK